MKHKGARYYAFRYGMIDLKKMVEDLQFLARHTDNATRHKLKQIKEQVNEIVDRDTTRNRRK